MAAALVGACSRTPPAPTSATPASSASATPTALQTDSGAAGATSVAPSLPPPPPSWRHDHDCARDLHPTGDAAADVEALARLCAPGMVVAAPTTTLALAPNAPREVSVHVDAAGTCLRVIAYAASDARGLSIELAGAEHTLAETTAGDRWVLAPDRGPVCLRKPGDYRVVVRAPASVEVTLAVRASAP